MKTCSVKEFQINISRRGPCQYQLFLVSVKILKKELYHRSSSQILIIPSRIYHVSTLLKLFFQYSSLNFSLQQFTIKSWVTCQNKFNMFLSVGFKKHVRPTSRGRPQTSHHLFPGTSRNWVLQTSPGRPHLKLLNICFFSKKQ